MTLQEQIKLDNAVKQINEILRCESVAFKESVLKRIIKKDVAFLREINDVTVASTSNVNESFAPGAGATVAREYDQKAIIEIDGVEYYIGLYEI